MTVYSEGLRAFAHVPALRCTCILVLAACASASRPVPPVPATPPTVSSAPQIVRTPPPEPDASYTFRYVGAPSPFVEIAVTTRSAELGPTTFDLGTGFADVRDPETSVRDVSARDDRGDALAIAHPTPHIWRVTAAPGHRVTLRYAVFSTHPPGSGDRFRTIVTEHLVHFVGVLALMRPTDLGDGKHAIRFTWEGLDEAKLHPATSFGSNRSHDLRETFDAFGEAVFIASDAMRLTTRPAGDGTLELAVIGSWTFSDTELADYIVRVMTMERSFFDDQGPPYFFVSVFPLGEGTSSYGGTGYTHSFDLALASGLTLDASVRAMIAHEHFHSWNGEIISPEAFEELTYWFTEGFTNFYTARLRYRGGLISLDDYAQELDEAIRSYLRSPAREAPNARTVAFWNDPAMRKLPYDRGHVIALVADREIRRASGGKVSLDNVMRVLVDAGRKGSRITTDRVLAMIEGLTSTAFGARLRATVIDGAPLAIDPSLLAPCLTGATAKMRTYELGFDWPASQAARKIIGLQSGSAAARAGLREGDSLGGYSITQGDPDQAVELKIGPTRRKISYLPRGTQIAVPQLTVHDAAACAGILGPPLP
jgi:predicted metalloprotease with PDZ domain